MNEDAARSAGDEKGSRQHPRDFRGGVRGAGDGIREE